jgi:hypothetical protein
MEVGHHGNKIANEPITIGSNSNKKVKKINTCELYWQIRILSISK